MAEDMQAHWNNSKAGAPEQHKFNKLNTEMFNERFGADMEPKEEGSDEAVESVFEVLAGAHNLRPNPDPTTDPNPNPNPDPSKVVTRLTMEGKGANGTTIKGYPRPGSRGMSKNAVAYTF